MLEYCLQRDMQHGGQTEPSQEHSGRNSDDNLELPFHSAISCLFSFHLLLIPLSLFLPHHIPFHQDRCKTLFKQVYQERQLRGRANDAVAAACLFIACRQEEVPRSFKEICAVSRHPKKEIGKCFKLIRLATNTEVNPATTSDFMVGCLWFIR